MNPSDKEKIKVGLLLDSYSVSAWEYLMLEKIIKSDVAGIRLIVKNNRTVPIKPQAIIQKKAGTIFYIIYIEILIRKDTDRLRTPLKLKAPRIYWMGFRKYHSPPIKSRTTIVLKVRILKKSSVLKSMSSFSLALEI